MIERTEAVPESIAPIVDLLMCPRCGGLLAGTRDELRCGGCEEPFPVEGGIPDLRPPGGDKPELEDWSCHWSMGNQRRLSQRFFSAYRKAVFARTVEYYVNRYLPEEGVLLEAGSGTSETSGRIDTREGARTLVAVDLFPPVLSRCHEIMQVKIAADIFRLPFFTSSLDGIWNVGVMEHFRHDEIDHIMREFHRVLRPGGGLVLLWPASDSLPQKVLRAVEKLVAIGRDAPRFRFHPPEISLLRSNEQAREVLWRNRFASVRIDRGIRSLMGFKILVGRKAPEEGTAPPRESPSLPRGRTRS